MGDLLGRQTLAEQEDELRVDRLDRHVADVAQQVLDLSDFANDTFARASPLPQRHQERADLAAFFESTTAPVRAPATLWALAKQGKIKPAFVQKAIHDLKVDPEKGFAEIV